MDVAEYERRFRADGLPLLIEDFRASEDVWTRALPVLAVVFVFELFGALNFSWGPAANVLAIVGGALVLLAGFGIANRVQGKPFGSIPSRIGRIELIAFVAIPAMLPLIFGGQWRSAMVTMALNILLLGIIYLVVAYGVFSILSWSGRRFFGQLSTSLQLLSKALPLVMVSSLLLFFTNELWQVFANLQLGALTLVSVLVLGLGALFIAVRLPGEVAKLQQVSAVAEAPLSRPQRMNVGLVMFIAQAMQIGLVVIGIGGFFILMGSVAASPEVQMIWTTGEVHVLWMSDPFGVPVVITQELLVVSGGLAAFGGLYFAIAVLTDNTYREEFHEHLVTQMEETFRLRGEYLRLLDTGSARVPEAPTG